MKGNGMEENRIYEGEAKEGTSEQRATMREGKGSEGGKEGETKDR